MKKNYFFFLLILITLFTTQYCLGQNTGKVFSVNQNIEELSIYPNPVSDGKTRVFITSKLNATKHIEFYNVLGKRIFSTHLQGKELNISNFSKGVYLLKITENNISETRKLIIK
jgi:hypothetical protein